MNIKQGDTIGIIALSGDCDEAKVNASKSYFESLGFNVVLSKNITHKNRYLAGSDRDKIKELESFFLNPDIKLIICARGGYGAIRLINKINYKIAKLYPKPVCGFSDATAILLMLYKKAGLITYHAPMACTDFAVTDNKISEFTLKNFFETLNAKILKYNGDKTYQIGSAKGIIWGGNLSTVASLCGINFIPNNDFIFFTEDVNEPVYKIDRMFQQLFNIKKFKKFCKGIVLGEFTNVDSDSWLEEYFYELGKKLKIPVISGFKITHNDDKITIPIGKNAEISGKTLIIK